MAIRDTITELLQSVKKSTTDTQEKAKVMFDSMTETAVTSIKDSITTYKDFIANTASSQQQHLHDSMHYAIDSLYIYDFIEYRQKKLAETMVTTRILTLFFANLPLFYFSSGLRKIRNPIVFTTFAALLLVPEVINPFNRR